MFIAVAQNNYRIRIRISLCSKILNMSKQTLEQKKENQGDVAITLSGLSQN